MIDLIVYGFYFFILANVVLGKPNVRFFALLVGTILFPNCALFWDNPSISGQIVFLYTFLLREFVFNYSELKKIIFENTLKKSLFFIAFSYLITTLFNFSMQNTYYAVRDMLDVYGYLIAAMIAAKRGSLQYVVKNLYWIVIPFCIYGLYEAFTNTNIIYKVICKSFPLYDGWYNLSGQISASESWRIRTIITTKHPTTLGTLLLMLFVFYLTMLKNKSITFFKAFPLLLLLGCNIVLSGSRTSLFCAFIVSLYAFMKSRGIIIKIACIGFMFFSTSFAISYVANNLMNSKDGSSIALRLNQLIFSIEKIKDSPLWGNGSNYTAHQIKDEKIRFDDNDEFIGGLESVAFIYMIDRGFLGVFSFYLMWLIFAHNLRKKNNTGAKNYFEILAIAPALFLTISGIIGNNIAFCFLFSGLLLYEPENPNNANKSIAR